MTELAHYAEAFYLQSECCFRPIHAEDGTGHAQYCPYITEWGRRFKDNGGKWHTVQSRERPSGWPGLSAEYRWSTPGLLSVDLEPLS